MKNDQLKRLVPILAFFALGALFLKLPEVPDFLGLFECKKCLASDPYAILAAAGYFAVLLAAYFLFPNFPSKEMARAGFLWAVLLMFALTFINSFLCIPCLIAHACNICIWGIWITSPISYSPICFTKERFCGLLFAPLIVVTFFCCLNLTFLVYSIKAAHQPSGLKAGDTTPIFNLKTVAGRDVDSGTKAILNFIMPDCPYCQEQLPIVFDLASRGSSYRIINVTTVLPSKIEFSGIEWAEDRDGKLRSLFRVGGFPTLFVLNSDGKLEKVIPGVSAELQNILLGLGKD